MRRLPHRPRPAEVAQRPATSPPPNDACRRVSAVCGHVAGLLDGGDQRSARGTLPGCPRRFRSLTHYRIRSLLLCGNLTHAIDALQFRKSPFPGLASRRKCGAWLVDWPRFLAWTSARSVRVLTVTWCVEVWYSEFEELSPDVNGSRWLIAKEESWNSGSDRQDDLSTYACTAEALAATFLLAASIVQSHRTSRSVRSGVHDRQSGNLLCPGLHVLTVRRVRMVPGTSECSVEHGCCGGVVPVARAERPPRRPGAVCVQPWPRSDRIRPSVVRRIRYCSMGLLGVLPTLQARWSGQVAVGRPVGFSRRPARRW